jgi:hypothetical protein
LAVSVVAAGKTRLRTKILKMNKISIFGARLRDNVGLSEDIEMLHTQLERCAMQQTIVYAR